MRIFSPSLVIGDSRGLEICANHCIDYIYEWEKREKVLAMFTACQRQWMFPVQSITFNPFLPTVAFNICCPRDCVSRTANVERNGGQKWVKLNVPCLNGQRSIRRKKVLEMFTLGRYIVLRRCTWLLWVSEVNVVFIRTHKSLINQIAL